MFCVEAAGSTATLVTCVQPTVTTDDPSLRDGHFGFRLSQGHNSALPASKTAGSMKVPAGDPQAKQVKQIVSQPVDEQVKKQTRSLWSNFRNFFGRRSQK